MEFRVKDYTFSDDLKTTKSYLDELGIKYTIKDNYLICKSEVFNFLLFCFIDDKIYYIHSEFKTVFSERERMKKYYEKYNLVSYDMSNNIRYYKDYKLKIKYDDDTKLTVCLNEIEDKIINKIEKYIERKRRRKLILESIFCLFYVFFGG